MLAKCKDVRLKKEGESPPKNFFFMSVAYSEIFSGWELQILTCISRVFFSGRIILKHLEIKKGSSGVWGHAPSENF